MNIDYPENSKVHIVHNTSTPIPERPDPEKFIEILEEDDDDM